MTAIAIGMIALRFTIGMVAEPFYSDCCYWVYRAATVLLIPSVAVSLLRPSSLLPGLMAMFGLSVLVARWFGGDSIETYSPVLAGVLTAMSASTIRKAAVLRALCWEVGVFALFTAVLLLLGDLATGGFRERLGFGWSAAYASAMALPEGAPKIFNPNEAALPLAILLSFTLSLVATSDHPIFRAAAWLMGAGAILGLLATGSRGMMLAGLVGFIVSAFSSIRSWPRVLGRVVMLACGGVLTVGSLILLADLEVAWFLRSDLLDQLGTYGDRYVIWETSLRGLAGHPFLGPGRSVIDYELQSPHNSIISALELAGGTGLGVLLLLMALTVQRARRSACFGLPVVMCIYSAGLSIDILVHPLAWAMLGLGCSPASRALWGRVRPAVRLPWGRSHSGLEQSVARGARVDTPPVRDDPA